MLTYASRAVIYCAIALLPPAVSLAQFEAAHQGPCDPALKSISISGDLGYKQRDAIRCEGLYQPPKSGEIELISFASSSPSSANVQRGQIEVDIPHTTVGPKVVLRVSTLKEETFYRLDALASSGSVFIWPASDVLGPAGLTPKDLGFLGWIEKGSGREFVPLSVKANGLTTSDEHSLLLVIRSPLPIEWVKWRVYALGESAMKPAWGKVPGTGFPAGWPISIQMPKIQSGSYLMEVYAMPENRDTPETLSIPLRF
jgi:hypothetical protein